MILALLSGASSWGCGEILEIPVGMPTDAGTSGDSGNATGYTSTSVASSAEDTLGPDFDTESTSSEGGESSSGGPGGGPELISACLPLGVTPIPEDGSWAELAIEMPPHDRAVALGVNLRVTHPRLSDLRITLRAPDGDSARLVDLPNCDGNGIAASFGDAAAQPASDQCLTGRAAAITGDVTPLDPLDPLLSSSVEGTWTIEATDATTGEAGQVDGACVTFLVEGG